ncbi:alanine--tRNA ligase [Buchnera aphidicola]|uniref:Alanine--tRNA ligase n=1 Tax=Buchnera aphidicola (Cinara strobi) TaxID=1921549 RepID=A0A3B1E9K0_9GAMM|nr:alanine--tRNA ligase [Buchnera aphidicola]VAX76669.1 Alanine--tRNA ligase [Buchnera aphidicola (Cinara strobi)]
MKTDEIRTMFLKFFKEKKHHVVSSSSLIPKNDDTLLFTNAGMNQFKDIYLGYKKIRPISYASSQYCIRTGGKHDDFEKVGYAPYHHTLFEMLGNFSFGEYFKEKAIQYAWEFLTHKKWLGLSKDKIWITYYYCDQETKNTWLNIIKIQSNHLIEIHDHDNVKYNSDNFWKMGDSGPCGPCTEIFYDTRKKNKKNKIIKNNKDLQKHCIEIWNLVFMQFNQTKSNKLIPLPILSVDTGMGLERISIILQNVSSSYKTDNFLKLIASIQKKINIKKKNNIALRIIADHIRTTVCLISEGILPGNEGRSYVLRRIIRRALSHGYFMGIRNPFFYKLSKTIINSMKNINIEFNISRKINNIKNILLNEERQFHFTIKNGMKKLKKIIKKIKNNQLCEKKIFYLYETFGLPIEITKDICKEKKIFIDSNKLNKIIKSNQKKQKIKNKKKVKKNSSLIFITKKSIFDGYREYIRKSKVVQIIHNNSSQSKLLDNSIGIIILNITPFYGESSGQIGDSGEIKNKNGTFIVQDTQKYKDYIAHIGFMKTGTINIKDIVTAKINIKKRRMIQSNHTSTHLLHAALKKIFNSKIVQKGSLINEHQLRFDFSCHQDITEKIINDLDIIINKKIQKNIPINTITTSFQKAKKYNAEYLFSKKYKKTVRLIEINNFSIELCTGTHHTDTGQIGSFKIISCKNIGKKIKRIIAITGIKVINYLYDMIKKEKKINQLFKTNKENTYHSIKKLFKKIEKIKKENEEIKKKNIQYIANNLLKTAKTYNKILLIIQTISNIKHIHLRIISDIIQKKINSAIIILINTDAPKITFLISVSHNVINNIHALEIAKILFLVLPGKGGGKKNIVEGRIIKNNISIQELKKIKDIILKKIK